jgi:peptidoglycan/LPS O-acetylase OafA/YrhL
VSGQRGVSTHDRHLDSFRFFAFLAVFLFHAGWLDCGYLGVWAFFVLSGFLLTPILLKMKERLPRRDYFLNFYGRRALRIFPLYYAYLGLGGLAAWGLVELGGRQDVALSLFLREWPWAAGYAYNFFHAASSADTIPHSTIISHFWSLAVEEQFYLIWPLFLWLVPLRHTRRALVCLVLAGPLLRALTWLAAQNGLLGGPGGRPDLVVYLLPWSSLDAFALGGWLALRHEALPRWSPWAGVGAVVALGLLSGLPAGFPAWTSLGYPPFMGQAGQAIWGYSLLALACGLVLHALRRGVFLPRLFALAPLQYLGKVSYGLYVFHYPVMSLTNRAFGHSQPDPARVGLMLGLTVFLSAASYELYEKRFLARKDRWFPTSERTPNP